MKKALILASVASMIEQFNMDNIKILQELGYMVDVMANFEYGSTMPQNKVNAFKKDLLNKDIIPIQVSIPRKIFDIMGILKSYCDVKKACEENKYEILHCHSPIGGVVARLAAVKSRKKYGTRIIYTAHGFHFFKGSPLVSWILYFPLEWFCSFFTDMIITINKEDFSLAKKYMHAKKVVYVPGVGVDTEKIENTYVNIKEKRQEIGISENDIAVLSVGELSDRKNHETIIRSIAKLRRSDITYVICGEGEKKEYLKTLAKELNVKLILLGYRDDIAAISKSCDLFAFPSKREGLGLAAIEAMSAGLPVVGSNINGILDYLIDGEVGYSCNPIDVDTFSEKIGKLIENKELRRIFGKNNIKAARKFDIKYVSKIMKKLYEI